MTIEIPQLALVALVGVSGSGKSTFAARHFGPYEVVSSDTCRGMVSNDELDQSATADAFDLLGYIVSKRLSAGLLTVVDATNVTRAAREQILELARAHHALPVAIVLDVPLEVALARNAARTDRDIGAHVVRRHHDALRRSRRGLGREGFRGVHVLRNEEIDDADIVRVPLRSDLRDVRGPFDVIGDVHGCADELATLLTTLGYELKRDEAGRAVDAVHAQGRTAVFVGDLIDRGPDNAGVLRLVMGMHAAGHALAVPGNHENKLVKALDGKNVTLAHGLDRTLADLEEAERGEPGFSRRVRDWCDGLVAHLVLDGGNLVVAHAGLKEEYQGRASGRVRSFALYGDTTGETDEFGLPVRYPWARDYRGAAMVLYGHTPTPEVEWVNNTMCLDTGCVFGGELTALRYPEKEIVSVPAAREYTAPVRPLAPAQAPRRADDLDLGDVLGRRAVQTAYHGRVTIREDNAAGALEVMSRFAVHPRLLNYLPPTMAPVATSSREGVLEHPDEAFTYFAEQGVTEVVCEEKHMGSRAVVLLCRDQDAATRRFGSPEGETGAVYTRTGRPFFDEGLREMFLDRVRAAVEKAGLWDELATTWLLLDAELLPWSLKADPLLRETFASTGAAARAALPPAIAALEAARRRGLDVVPLLERTREREAAAASFTDAYRRYRWDVDGLDGVQLAPFALLAGEGRALAVQDHHWHLRHIDAVVDASDGLLRRTRRHVVQVREDASRAEGVAWWEELTADGGEGMVVKPAESLVRGPKGVVQPGLKVRGQDYLRLVYGPDYLAPANLGRLRERNLGTKRSLAAREYALGLEALDRLVAGEPTWRVHEAVFAVLALESEPVDPRL